jgi:hypothetical protein
MENRNGLLLDIEARKADGFAERAGALDLLARQGRKKVKPKTVGADKAYHTREFVPRLRKRGIAPHVACMEKRQTPGLDGRTARHDGYPTNCRTSHAPTKI